MSSFGPFSFDSTAGALSRDGKAVAIGTRGAALLAALIEADGAPVGKDALMEAGWPGLAVEEGNLSVQIANLRKALGPRPDGQDWIATVPRVGYRLLKAAAAEPETADFIFPSLAVLPFSNLSADPEQEYFADGVVDDIITALSRFRSFAVIARNSSFVYKGRAVDVRDVGRELGVRYVLEGSVRKAGGKLRITAQLVEAATGTHLWASNFDGETADVFEFQDRITESVAGIVEPTVKQAEIIRSRRKHPDRLDAYDLLLQADQKHYLVRPDDNAEALALVEKAIALAPNYAAALAVAAWVLEFRIVMGWPSLTDDDRGRCLRYCERALMHAEGDMEVIGHIGTIIMSVGREYERGLQMITNAVEANPNDAYLVMAASITHLHAGSLDQALAYAHRALRLSPTDPTAHWPLTAIAHAHMALGDFGEALRWAEKSLAVSPQYDATHWMLIAANAQLGRPDEAKRWVKRFLDFRPTATISAIRKGQPDQIPGRMTAILEGLRIAGLPDS